jgi:uncharacterized protein YndB with AHSA1/START domain
MTEPLRINHRFEVSAERVFEAFVDVHKASKFLFATPTGRMVRAELEPRVGGALLFVERRGEQDVEHVGTVVELERPTRFAFDFRVPSVSPQSTRVTVEISPKGKGCELTLIHEGVPPDAKQRSGDGWHKILDQLERQLGRD